MNSRKMITRQSSRNTLRADTQTDSLALDDDTSETEGAGCRDYNLNYDRAMRKKARSCQTGYLVTSTVKGNNYIFSFSTAMYELYREKLADHYRALNENSPDIRVTFKDSTDKTGMVVESLMKVYQKSSTGKGRPKYSINMYHTNTRVMVNGRQATQFNAEHSKITDYILGSEKVADLDKEIYRCIEEGLKTLAVGKPQIDANENQHSNSGAQRGSHENINIPQSSSANQNELSWNAENGDSALCPTCDLAVEDGINCERCDSWFHFTCEDINDNERIIHESTDSVYICMTCSFENQCEGISESLTIESRNIQEPEPDSETSNETIQNTQYSHSVEETHRKEGYEPGPVASNQRDLNMAECTPVNEFESEHNTPMVSQTRAHTNQAHSLNNSKPRPAKTKVHKLSISNSAENGAAKRQERKTEETEVLSNQILDKTSHESPVQGCC